MSKQFGANLDDHGFDRYEENAFPLAYLLTFRTFGTWLHGDGRGSMQRSRGNRLSTLRLDPNVPLNESMRAELRQTPIILSRVQREIVDAAIIEICDFRGYALQASNVRTNHVHAVISAKLKPEKIVNEFKTFATRKLRQAEELEIVDKIWSRGASTRYLWKPAHVTAAVDYVLYSQGDVPFRSD